MPEFDPEFMAGLILSVGALLWTAKLIRDLFWPIHKTRLLNEPVYVDMVKEFTPAARTDKLEEQMREGFGKLGEQLRNVDNERKASVARSYDNTRQMIRELRDEFRETTEAARKDHKEDIVGLHDRLHDVLKGISRLEGKVDQS